MNILDEIERQLQKNKELIINKNTSYWKDCKYYFSETLNGDYLGILKNIPIKIIETNNDITFKI